MKTEKSQPRHGLFSKLRKKMAGKEIGKKIRDNKKEINEETRQMLKEFEAVKRHPGHLEGWDFDRAFDFVERYPDSAEAEILIGQMYATSGQQLKGLSYLSAVKVLERMPGHAGTDSIISGIYKVEKDYLVELRSDVISYILKTFPDHPLCDEMTRILARKNLTVAYEFVTGNPENEHTRELINAMFERDANISILLLQEKMGHSQVDAIFEGIYGITDEAAIKALTPSAIAFILDVAPDHPKAVEMIDVLVEQNYVKAYDFARLHPDHALIDILRERILVRKPELAKLFES